VEDLKSQTVERVRADPEQYSSVLAIVLSCLPRHLHLLVFLLFFPLGLNNQWVQEDKES